MSIAMGAKLINVSIAMDAAYILADQNPHWGPTPRSLAAAFPYERRQLRRCEQQFIDASSRRALALIGLRYVGKTVILRQLADRLLRRGVDAQRIVYCNLADERWSSPPSPREIVSVAERGLNRPAAPLFFLFDEIQLFPNWHTWLKLAVDDGAHRFVVTGSAASSLRHGARESGPGRWDEVPIETLSYSEFRDFVGLSSGGASPANLFDAYLARGGFPAHAFSDDVRLVRSRLREDVADRTIVRDLVRLQIDVEQARRLFLYLAEHSGAMLDESGAAAHMGVDRKSLSKWLSLLLDTGLLVALAPTTTRQSHGPARADRVLRGMRKIHVADHSLVSAFAPIPSPMEDAHFRGQAYEAMVFRHLREARQALREDPDRSAQVGDVHISYWRGERPKARDAKRDADPDSDGGDGEIDFIVDTRSGRVAVEVTAARPRSAKLRKLRAAGERAGAGRLVLVCSSLERVDVEGVEVVPIEDFIAEPIRFVEVGR
jgi:predicted AAA+ superfamily ATPase